MSFDEHKPARIERGSPAPRPIPIEPEAPPSDRGRACPGCGRPMRAGSVVCVACGLDLRAASSRNHAEHADTDTPKPCLHCGYDLRGLKAFVCPECGKTLKGRSWRRDRDALMAKDAQRIDYLKPLVMIPVCAVVMTGAVAVIQRSWEDMARLWITLGAGWLIGMVVYAAYGLIWLGFESPWRLTVLRIGAAYFCTEALVLGQGTITFWPGLAVFSMVCYAALLWDLLDLDIPDCFMLSVFTIGIATGIRLWIKAYM